MKILIHSKEGDSAGLAWQFQKDGADVSFFIKEKWARRQMDGIVPKVETLEEGLKTKPDFILFDLNGDGETADKVKSAALSMAEKLGGLQKRPGEAVEFLRKTFAGEGPNAEEDMMNLLAFDKMVTEGGGKSVIQPLFKALTAQYFSPALAGNQVSRQIAGASPFLISAFFRILGMPFQASLPIGAAIVTAARSPRGQGAIIRGAQEGFGPKLAQAAKSSASAVLNLIRQRFQGDQDE
jgi:hypothetical protein